jgi:predicted NBD/HSP70 family sugar kinase
MSPAPASGDRARRDASSAALELIHTAGTLRRTELTARLGLSRSAVGAVVEDLRARQLILVETRPGPAGEAGRPSHQVSLHPDGPVVVAIQLRSDSYRVAVVGLGGELVSSSSAPLPQPSTPERVLGAIARDAVAAAASCPRSCLGVGVAVPSAVSRVDQHALAALYLRWPSAVPVRTILSRLIGAELPVHVGNDANLAALAEFRHGAGVGASDMLFLTTGQRGVGGGLVVGGRLFTGSAGYALELGHLTVDPAGRECHCGNRGCLDVEADPRALVEAAGIAVTDEGDVEAAARDVMARAARDPRAGAAVARVADRLAVGLAGLVNLFNPDRIVLGGLYADVLGAMAERMADALRRRSLLSVASEVPLCAAALADDAIILGAGELALQPLLDQPRLLTSSSRQVGR